MNHGLFHWRREDLIESSGHGDSEWTWQPAVQLVSPSPPACSHSLHLSVYHLPIHPPSIIYHIYINPSFINYLSSLPSIYHSMYHSLPLSLIHLRVNFWCYSISQACLNTFSISLLCASFYIYIYIIIYLLKNSDDSFVRFIFMFRYVCLNIHMCNMSTFCLQRPEKGIGSPGSGVIDSRESPHRFRGPTTRAASSLNHWVFENSSARLPFVYSHSNCVFGTIYQFPILSWLGAHPPHFEHISEILCFQTTLFPPSPLRLTIVCTWGHSKAGRSVPGPSQVPLSLALQAPGCDTCWSRKLAEATVTFPESSLVSSLLGPAVLGSASAPTPGGQEAMGFWVQLSDPGL